MSSLIFIFFCLTKRSGSPSSVDARRRDADPVLVRDRLEDLLDEEAVRALELAEQRGRVVRPGRHAAIVAAGRKTAGRCSTLIRGERAWRAAGRAHERPAVADPALGRCRGAATRCSSATREVAALAALVARRSPARRGSCSSRARPGSARAGCSPRCARRGRGGADARAGRARQRARARVPVRRRPPAVRADARRPGARERAARRRRGGRRAPVFDALGGEATAAGDARSRPCTGSTG